MIYKKKDAPELSRELFKNPTSEYRSTPFWAWNSTLDKDELARQIDEFAEMGYGGFHMHVRQGLESEYLGDEFMDAVKFCVEKAKEKNMLAWLYDEDRWPSGVAGGFVTKNKKYRQKFLTMSVTDREECAASAEEAAETGLPYFLGAFSVSLDGDGNMISYRPVERDEDADGKKYFFIEQKQGGEARYNMQSYVDTMQKEAIDEFIGLTYEGFKDAVGADFGNAVPAIFTDEPQVAGRFGRPSAFGSEDAFASWTTDFAETYEAEYSTPILDRLPEIFFHTTAPQAMKTRYNYYTHVSRRFAEAYMDNIGDWCEGAGIALTGHVLGEDSLYEASLNTPDIMRAYRRMQLPGIDLLCDDLVYNTPIQCRSIVRQYGREGMLTELYGVTGWDFDFRGHKFQGDWQACLGATVRVPHLAWQTMKGEGKRDYPATLSYQSSWYKEYKLIEDHFARISTVMTRGTPETRIAVIYPIDTYNMYYSSHLESKPIRDELDECYNKTAEWLLAGAYDFDYISESLLPELCTVGTAPLAVGKMNYDLIIVANCETLRAHTVNLLEQFKKYGGNVIVMGRRPYMVEGEADARAAAVCQGACVIPQSKDALYRAVSAFRDVEVRDAVSGARTTNLMCNMRRDGDNRWLILAHMYKPELPHLINKQDIKITVKGNYRPFIYDTMNGEVYEADFVADGSSTTVFATVYDLDTLLIKYEPLPYPSSKRSEAPEGEVFEVYHAPVSSYKLSEDNVLLLDMARFGVDGEPLSEYPEEILRIDARVRAQFGYESRKVKFVQPWTITGEPEPHSLHLAFTVRSEIAVEGARLAIERPDRVKIRFNGRPVSNKPDGYYADREIKTVMLPKIKKGENTLEIFMPFGLRTDLEACYLIGSFGTAYTGREAYITTLPEKLHFGSVVHQGLAFYGANIEYNSNVILDAPCDLDITVSQYRGAVVGVMVDGRDVGRIAYPPFTLTVPDLEAGEHEITYTLYGTRYNTFSALHNLNASKKRVYIGPIYWRSEEEAWAYEYQTRPMGILKTPVLKARKK